MGKLRWHRARPGSRLLGVFATDRGWTEVRWPGVWRTHRWSELLSVEGDDAHARLVTRRAELVVDARLTDHLDFLARARQASGQTRGAAGAVSANEVAGWLGIASDGELVCATDTWRHSLAILRRAYWRVSVPGAALLLVLAVVFGRRLGVAHAIAPAVFALMQLASAVVQVDRRRGAAHRLLVDEVRARPDGLTVRWAQDGRTCRFAWDSVRAVEAGERAPRLRLAPVTLELLPGMSEVDRLLDTARAVIAAREAGLALPRLAADVPETALSRASVVVDSQRGLSRDGEGR